MSNLFSSYWFVSAIYSLAQRFAIAIFGLLSFLMLIRVLSVEYMSYWSIYLLIISIFESIKTNLIKNAFIKYYIQSKTDNERLEVSSSAFMVNLALSIVFVLFILLFSEYIGEIFKCRDVLPEMLYWYLPGVLFQTIFSHLEFLNQAAYNFKKIFYGYFAKQLFMLFFIGIIYFYFQKEIDLRILSFGQSLSILIGFLIMLYKAFRLRILITSVSKIRIKELLNYGKFIFGSGLMATIFANVDQLLTASVLSSKTIAFYNAASKINALVDIPSYAAAEVAFPRLAKADQYEGLEKVKYLYEKMVSVLMAITLPVSLIIIIFPSFIIRLIAGAQYLPAVIILQIYMFTSILRPMQNQAANVLNSTGKEALCFYINMISLIVNLIINYILIRQYGFYGSAYGTLISFITGCFIWYLFMRKLVNIDFISILKSIPQTYKLIFNEIFHFQFKRKFKEQ